MKIEYITGLFINFCAGSLIARWVKVAEMVKWETTQWHLWQFASIGLLTFGCLFCGFIVGRRCSANYHNVWGYCGRFVTVFAVVAIGYIVGLELL